MRIRALLLGACVLLFAGCAATDPKVEGPTATVADTAGGGGPGGGTFFSVYKLDGQPIRNGIESSRRMSYGMGANLRIARVERQLPAGRPIRLEIVGQVAYGAPIQELFASARDRLYRVDGTLEVTLQAGRQYRVNGVLDELHAEVWLEDADGSVIGRKITAAPSKEALRAAAVPERYTCCNLHYDSDRWVSDANWTLLPFMPAGTPIRVYEVRKDRAKAQAQGAPVWLGIEYSAKQQTMQQYLDKLVVDQDPTARLAAYPADVQEAIRAGRVMTGMTREQVLMSLGYPSPDKTPSLERDRWAYRASDEAEFTVVWGADGRVASVEAPGVSAAVLQGAQ